MLVVQGCRCLPPRSPAQVHATGLWQSWKGTPGPSSSPHPTNPSLQVPVDAVNGRHRNGAPQASPKGSLPLSPLSNLHFHSRQRCKTKILKNRLQLLSSSCWKNQAKPHRPPATGRHRFDGEGARDGTPQPPPLSKGSQRRRRTYLSALPPLAQGGRIL